MTSVNAMIGSSNAATNTTNISGRLNLIHKETSALRVESTDIRRNVLIRTAQSGSKSLATAAVKFLSLDSGTNAAEILGMTINGIVGQTWKLDYYIPAIDAVAAQNASELRVTENYSSADTAGGQITGFAFPFNCYIDFTNLTSVAAQAQKISQVSIVYRSATALAIAWEA
jgi:hypothetical protein